jgi:predicted transcriptional regulator
MANLDDLVRRAKSWPEEAQDELALLAREIEAELAGGTYRASAAEMQGIERGLRDAAEGRFVSEADVEATFAKYRK